LPAERWFLFQASYPPECLAASSSPSLSASFLRQPHLSPSAQKRPLRPLIRQRQSSFRQPPRPSQTAPRERASLFLGSAPCEKSSPKQHFSGPPRFCALCFFCFLPSSRPYCHTFCSSFAPPTIPHPVSSSVRSVLIASAFLQRPFPRQQSPLPKLSALPRAARAPRHLSAPLNGRRERRRLDGRLEDEAGGHLPSFLLPRRLQDPLAAARAALV
jgi:hypothetical protein